MLDLDYEEDSTRGDRHERRHDRRRRARRGAGDRRAGSVLARPPRRAPRPRRGRDRELVAAQQDAAVRASAREAPPRIAQPEQAARAAPGAPRWEIELLETDDEPVEDGATFLDNARTKARHGRGAAPAADWVAGEDSGIEVGRSADGPGSTRRAGRPTGRASPRRARGRRRRGAPATSASSSPSRPRATSSAPPGRSRERSRSSRAEARASATTRSSCRSASRVTVAELGNAWKAQHSHRAPAARVARASSSPPIA